MSAFLPTKQSMWLITSWCLARKDSYIVGTKPNRTSAVTPHHITCIFSGHSWLLRTALVFMKHLQHRMIATFFVYLLIVYSFFMRNVKGCEPRKAKVDFINLLLWLFAGILQSPTVSSLVYALSHGGAAPPIILKHLSCLYSLW